MINLSYEYIESEECDREGQSSRNPMHDHGFVAVELAAVWAGDGVCSPKADRGRSDPAASAAGGDGGKCAVGLRRNRYPDHHRRGSSLECAFEEIHSRRPLTSLIT